MPVFARFRPRAALALLLAGCTVLTVPAAPLWAETPRLHPLAPRQVQPVELDRARAQFDTLTRRAEGLRAELAEVKRQMAELRRLARQGRYDALRAALAQLAPRVEGLRRDSATLARLMRAPEHMRAVGVADRVSPGQAARWSDLVGEVALERDAAALRDALAQVTPEDARNKRQESQVSFENFDEKANQLFNVLSTVLKAMKDMQGATLRNMQ